MRAERSIPIFSLPNVVFYPKTALTLYLLEGPMVKIVRDCVREGRMLGITLSEHPSNKAQYQQNQYAKNICTIGHPTIIEESVDKRAIKVYIKGVKRVRLLGRSNLFPYNEFLFEDYRDVKEPVLISSNKLENLHELLNHWLILNISDLDFREQFSEGLETAYHLIDNICLYLIEDPQVKQILLECRSLSERISLLDAILNRANSNYETSLTYRSIKAYENMENTELAALN
jgi:uncharacterized protein